jgi:hypothetical protein
MIDDKQNIATLSSKLAAANAMLLRVPLSGFRRQTLLLVYRALLCIHIRYGCYGASVRQAAGRSRIKVVQVAQNKTMRIIFDLLPRDSTNYYLINVKSVESRKKCKNLEKLTSSHPSLGLFVSSILIFSLF